MTNSPANPLGYISVLLLMIDLVSAQTLDFIDSGQTLGDQYSTDVALGDVDGDGDLDAIVANTGFPVSGQARLWINQGGAQGGTPGVFAESPQDFGARNSEAVSFGDLDGDGDLDIFLGHEADGDRVWLNDGSGAFTDSGQSLGADQSWDVALGDLDGDGDLDAVVGTFGLGTTGQGALDRIWINQGGAQGGTPGTFAAGQDLDAMQTQTVVLLDADGDGDLDAMSGPGDTAIRLHINQGGDQGGVQGTFVSGDLPLDDRRAISLAVGDLDGDADPDLFAGLGSPAPPSRPWINQGGGQGGTPGTFLPGSDVFGDRNLDINLGDLDGDGDLDLYLPKWHDPGVGNEVWLNDGSGVFTDTGLRLGTQRSRAAELGDLDGDGDLDVFVINGAGFPVGNENRVWLNQRLTLPTPEADLVLDAAPQGTASARLENSFDPMTAGMELNLTNFGPDAATGIRMLVNGAGARLVSGSFSCAPTESGLDCSHATLPAGVTGTAILAGRDFRQHFNGIFAGSVSISARITSNEPDPNPNPLRATRTVDYYDCATGCVIEQLFCLSNFSMGTEGRGTASGLVDLSVYHLLRRMMNFGAEGQRLVQRYNAHQAELWALHEADPQLAADMQAALAAWQPGLGALVRGQGETVVIDAAMVAGLDALLVDLAAAGSPALATAIAEERALIGPLGDFIGMNFRDAADQLIPSDVIRVDGFERPELLTQ
jgi:hypothetical protein